MDKNSTEKPTWAEYTCPLCKESADYRKVHICSKLDIGLDRKELRALIYDADGILHEEVQREVESAIRQYPNQEAPHWLGGVAAISVVMKRLGLYHEDE